MSIDQAHERAITQLSALRGDLSPQEQDARKGTCPQCHKRTRWRRPRYRRSDGRPVDWVNAIGGHHLPGFVLRLARVAGAECRRCGQQWPVFATDASLVVEMTTRRELGDPQTKTINNSDGASGLSRTTKIEHRWTQSLNLTNESGTGIGIQALSMSAEREVKKHYELTLGTEIIESEEITVDVSGVKVSTITWRPEYVWRCGIVRMPYGKPIEYEARVAVNLLIDVTQADTAAARSGR